ncbi:IQ domain-containing protein IQM2-like isoform X1 [Solanum pennellii]|uniref:IQ domain-containing protein IQM2-like isoform X1 n=1 Tax=Solanum pennellii TaxID=28526 RepID=A0ABM1GIN2_SOLPN|nr:IQ domain-containing protein IQM2-like isoform X1 [Solanum pennellii]XP_015071582.1 IQ domain-containing protein IQM2-like isoform X1 [Solanum pennellii]
MGISFTCPLASHTDLENSLESVIVKSINFGDNEHKTPLRSISFKIEDSEPIVMQSDGSGNMLIEKSVSLRTKENVVAYPSSDDMMNQQSTKSPLLDCSSSPKHEAAVKLQKVYKSFRTRRKLADCAVLIEQSWWKLLDFAELKHSSISFFDLDKHETAISRWSRARTRAAKLGKGLSKNSKARKLALQHWLEAVSKTVYGFLILSFWISYVLSGTNMDVVFLYKQIDPRHRYGHNLHFYYVQWLHSQSKEPFFYWLDIGEGKEVNLVDKCPRWKLQQQCIKYLGPMERKAYEVTVDDQNLFYKETGKLLDTTGEPKRAKWIFVLSTSKTLYVGKKKKGTFQHSSFLAGGATLAAGRIVVEQGVLKAVWPHSGHYRPTPENFQDFISFLRENDVDLSDVKLDCVDEEDSIGKKSGVYLRRNASDDDVGQKDGLETGENDLEDVTTSDTNELKEEATFAASSHSFNYKLANLRIPNKDDLLEKLASESATVESISPTDGYESAEELIDIEQESKEDIIPQESILKRINSHKGMKSFQLGKQLSSKWSTGAGPRIGCLRDYPSQLQSHALEEANLSQRSVCRLKFYSRASSFSREMQVSCSI